MSQQNEILISFPGGKRVDADFFGTTIRTDQSKVAGGDASAPEPFALFLSSIGTCAGIYVLGFLQARDLPTEGVRLRQRLDFDQATHRLRNVELIIELPKSIPEKYHQAIMRAADMCAVKKTIQNPPAFDVKIETSTTDLSAVA